MYILKIKYYRKLNKLTQKQLADKVGLTQSYISKLESHRRTVSPQLRTLEKICNLFNIELMTLIEKDTLVFLISIQGIHYIHIIALRYIF